MAMVNIGLRPQPPNLARYHPSSRGIIGISVSGKLQLNRWQDRDGKDQERLQVIADAVLSAKTVRPAGGRRRNGEAGHC